MPGRRYSVATCNVLGRFRDRSCDRKKCEEIIIAIKRVIRNKTDTFPFLYKKIMNYYHICTEGAKDNVVFRDNEDYIAAMNYIAITCCERKVTLLAFCIMSNHFHFIVRSEFAEAQKFIISIKRRCSLKYWKKYSETRVLSGSRHPINIKEISDVEYLKSAIAYVLRNPLKNMGELAWAYPWCSVSAYFNGILVHAPADMLKDNSRRKNMKVLHSHFNAKGTALSVNRYGYIPPVEYVANNIVESIFVTPKSLLYFMNKDVDAEMDIEFTSLKRKMVTSDTRILNLLPSLLLDNFGVGAVDALSVKQKYSLMRILRQNFNSSPKQIARILRINPEIIK